MRAQHEREMSELRRYFEGVCRELELKYRAETEETTTARTRGAATPRYTAAGLSLVHSRSHDLGTHL